MSKYTGKKAVVIGGSHGVGLAIVKALLAEKAEVLLTGRNQKNLEKIRQELGTAVHIVRSDAASMTDIAALGTYVADNLGTIDYAFLNAGVSYPQPFEQVTEETYDQVFNVNTKGAFFTAQRLAPLIRNGGSFVFTTVTNEAGYAGLSVYSASKAALRAMAQVLAAELLPREIRVNAIAPGFIDTPTMGLTAASAEERSILHKIGDEVTPMKRHGTADEVAKAALFLAADATFTTGVELLVDGGMGKVGASTL